MFFLLTIKGFIRVYTKFENKIRWSRHLTQCPGQFVNRMFQQDNMRFFMRFHARRRAGNADGGDSSSCCVDDRDGETGQAEFAFFVVAGVALSFYLVEKVEELAGIAERRRGQLLEADSFYIFSYDLVGLKS